MWVVLSRRKQMGNLGTGSQSVPRMAELTSKGRWELTVCTRGFHLSLFFVRLTASSCTDAVSVLKYCVTFQVTT